MAGLLVIALVAVMSQANGGGGAWAADLLRAIVGPVATARIEATYLGATDALQGVTYRFGNQRASAPWVAPTANTHVAHLTVPVRSRPPTRSPGHHSARHAASRPGRAQPLVRPQPVRKRPLTLAQPVRRRPLARSQSARRITARVVKLPVPLVARAHSLGPMPLALLVPPVTPPLDGEGVWTTDGLPGATLHLPPVVKTFVRPDPVRPWALATIAQFDLRVAHLHMVAGISQPSAPVGRAGPGTIARDDWTGSHLLAVFNGGFKYADGAYGMQVGPILYVPPVWGAATIATTSAGHVIMGAWGVDHRLTGANRGLTAWRQNGALLIDHGHVTALTQFGSAWGLSIMNSTYTWRSGIGLTRHNTLVYVAGNALSATTLAQTLLAAGATTAMQLDINPFWVRAFTYQRDPSGTLVATRLNPAMNGTGMDYLYGSARDFFYLTR